MNRKKLLSLALLDLSAFALSQVAPARIDEARKNYETAYRIAKKNSVPNLQSYHDFITRFNRK